MLRNVVERWIDAASERSFDQPLMQLLRAHGFFDIHFTHGAYEFGKDFIAKRVEGGVTKQYAFQSKAGDIGGSEWDGMRGQLEDLVDSWLVHPNFDSTIPLEQRLVTTGRLVGKAQLSAKQFLESIEVRGRGRFQVWDRGVLTDMIMGSDPAFPVVAIPEGINQLLARAEVGNLGMSELCDRLTGCVPQPANVGQLRQALLGLSFLAADLWQRGQRFHAVRVTQHGCRLALCSVQMFPDATVAEELREATSWSIRLGAEASESLLGLTPSDLGRAVSSSPGVWAAYPAACLATGEALALGALVDFDRGNAEVARATVERLATFVQSHPGCSHPMGDRHSPALQAMLVALAVGGQRQAFLSSLRASTKWIADRIERGLGLAESGASEVEEVRRVFGAPFEVVDLPIRRESLLATVLLDVAYVFAPQDYEVILNELLAVGAIASGVHAADTPAGLFSGSGDAQALLNLQYPHIADGHFLAHHQIQEEPRRFEQIAGFGMLLMVSCLCGDRCFGDLLPRISAAADDSNWSGT